MNIKINYIVNKLIIFIFLTFPFWEVITAQLNFFLYIPFTWMGLLKYFILFFLITILLMNLLVSGLSIRYRSAIILGYIIYIGLHFIGSSHIILKFDGFRYEMLLPLIIFLLLSQKSVKIVSINTVIKIIFFQGFIIFFISCYEYIDQSILVTIYRKPLEEIPHITWFSLNRLISTVGNPINLGSSLIIWCISYIYCLRTTNNKVIKILFPLFILVSFFLILMTLSRTSLISFSFIVFLSLMLGSSPKNRIYIVITFVILTIILLGYFLQSVNLDLIIKRFGNLFSIKEYSENARVKNWLYAFSSLDHLEYLWGKGLGASTPTQEYIKKYDGLMIENGFISIIINYGFIGFSIFLIIFISFLKNAYYLYKKNKNIGIFLILFLITYSIYNMANDYNRNLPYSLYFWFFYYYSEMKNTGSINK